MAEQYRVDLSEIEGTISRLNRVLHDMGTSASNCKNSTYLPAGALGSAEHGFEEVKTLHTAHKQIQERLYEIVEHLEQVLDDFGQKTKRTHDAFADAEAQNRAAFNRQ
ncbi:hypothetical protein [Streptomyces poonensis]|uniref:Uncharacterized protein n=1 Tax=Streptomyces poonensis TaxID=68255 RepID=A0A918Q9Z4_9ACTN|nr:hypothetical protein [Streptomyces poonensis]GGZ39402.1 hypothetical protein GCM10010365_70300 [Streptomyces poonensis]GLJ93078.1 hypothetical protein GCM10017589_56900 [Streptomyces poonensis]